MPKIIVIRASDGLLRVIAKISEALAVEERRQPTCTEILRSAIAFYGAAVTSRQILTVLSDNPEVAEQFRHFLAQARGLDRLEKKLTFGER